MVSLRVRKAKISLFDDRVFLIPQSDRKTQILLFIADAGYTLFAPSVSLAACHVMGDVVPGVAISTVILAHGSPLAVAYIRPPFFPAVALQSCLLCIHGLLQAFLKNLNQFPCIMFSIFFSV